MVTRDASEADPLGSLADDFVERYRKGERPALSEYTEKHPELADQIQEVFPLLVMMEKANSESTLAFDADKQPQQSSQDQPMPDAIAGYRIEREIGRGGMGVVYEAEQLSLQRRVALKVLPAHALLREMGLERFQQEARVAASLHHTNIVPVYEVGEDQDTFFYSMQYIQGQSLEQVLRELRDRPRRRPTSVLATTQAFPDEALSQISNSLLEGFSPPPLSREDPTALFQQSPDQESQNVALLPGQSDPRQVQKNHKDYYRSVARVGIQVAEALDFAHRRGVLHRDIKPANLLLDSSSRVWITDFGLAKTKDVTLTQNGDIVGTLRYMAPERFQGECHALCDVFSLGVTLYEMLVLRPAFDSPDRVALVHQITRDDPPPLRTIDPNIPRDLETIVSTSIEKEAKRRYQSANALAEDLKRFLACQPILARRNTFFDHFWRWCRRNPTIAVLCLSIVLITALGFLGIFVQWQRATSNERRAVENERRALENAEEANTQRNELQATNLELYTTLDRLKRMSYNAKMNLAGHAWNNGGVRRVRELLDGSLPDRDARDLRDFEWYYLHRLCRANLLSLTGHIRVVRSVDSHPDGSRIASVDETGTIIIWDSRTGEIVKSIIVRPKVHSFAVAYSPDGKFLATANNDRTITLLDTDSYKVRSTMSDLKTNAFGIAFGPQGQQLASVTGTTSRSGQLTVWDVKSEQQVFSLEGFTSGAGALAFAPDGSSLAAVSQNRIVKLIDTKTGKEMLSIPSETSTVYSIAFSPVRTHLAIANGDRSVEIWDLESRKQLTTLRGAVEPIVSLAYSPDGSKLAGGSVSLYVWDLKSGTLVSRMHQQPNPIRLLDYSPDGERLLSVASESIIRIWDPDQSTLPITFSTPTPVLQSMAQSPSGEYFATCSNDQKVRLWETRSGKLLHVFHAASTRPKDLVFSPNSENLAVAGFERTVHIWDVKSKQLLHVLPERQAVIAIDYSPDGNQLASATLDHCISLWNLQGKSPRLVHLLKGHLARIRCVKFSPTGKLLASASGDKTVRLWNPRTGDEIATLQGHASAVTDLSFHPVDQRLATASLDHQLKIWDLQSGVALTTIKGHTRGVQRVSYSPSGNRLVSAGLDRTLKLWDVELEEEVLTLEAEDRGAVMDLAFVRDGTKLITAWDNGRIRIYLAPRIEP